MKALLAAILGAALAAAQNITGMPACATSCYLSAWTAAGCSEIDSACQCGSLGGSIDENALRCAASATSPTCNALELVTFASAFSAICAADDTSAMTTTTTTPDTAATPGATFTGLLSVTSATPPPAAASSTATGTASLTGSSTASSGTGPASQTNTPSQDASSGLSTGAKAGIGAGIAILVLVIAAVVLAVIRARRRKRSPGMNPYLGGGYGKPELEGDVTTSRSWRIPPVAEKPELEARSSQVVAPRAELGVSPTVSSGGGWGVYGHAGQPAPTELDAHASLDVAAAAAVAGNGGLAGGARGQEGAGVTDTGRSSDTSSRGHVAAGSRTSY